MEYIAVINCNLPFTISSISYIRISSSLVPDFRTLKNLHLILPVLLFTFQVKAQPANCIFNKPLISIHFGTGSVSELNTDLPTNYRRVRTFCPTDGHYTYTSFTSDCFKGDWHALSEDHTPCDVEGNMMLVNGSPVS